MQNPVLEPLDVLVGDWEIVLSNAQFFPDPTATLSGKATVEWLEDGAFLQVHTDFGEGGPPYSVSVIGRDDSGHSYTSLYFDQRGVSRVYSMSLEGKEWRQWRDAPDFSQRFTATFSDDGNIIRAQWEKMENGSTWEHDFDMTYRRVKK